LLCTCVRSFQDTQRTISAGILTLKSLKAQNDTLCPRNPVPRSNLTDEKKQQQLFLNCRAVLYNPAHPESSGSLVSTSDYTTKSHCRRHLADGVSEPESLRNLKLKACRNDKLATKPELLSTLVEIDRDKKARQGHSPATVPAHHAPNASGLPRHRVSAISGSSCSVSCSLYGHVLTLHRCGGLPRPEPKGTISAGTQTLKPFKTQTLCLRNPVPESRLKDEQKLQQLFLNRRAALYNSARPKTSKSLVSEYPTESHSRRHHADDMGVSKPETLQSSSGSVFYIWYFISLGCCLPAEL